MSASKVDHASTISPHVMGVETESFLLSSNISEQTEISGEYIKEIRCNKSGRY